MGLITILLIIYFSFLLFLFRLHWSSSVSEMIVPTPSNNTSNQSSMQKEFILFDFTKEPDLNNWTEESDTVREVGKSKATFELQKTKLFQRGIFFTLLNPQDNGAGFAGCRVNTKFNLNQYDKIILYARSQGANSGYKVVLRHNGLNDEPHPTYEQIFQVKPGDEFKNYELPLSEFQPFYRGRYQPDAPKLNKSNITRFGLQVFGGVYMDYKQKGVSSLEIDFVKAI